MYSGDRVVAPLVSPDRSGSTVGELPPYFNSSPSARKAPPSNLLLGLAVHAKIGAFLVDSPWAVEVTRHMISRLRAGPRRCPGIP